MSYYLAPSLVQLRNEVNARWPNRSKVSDGWIGDASHSARASDHNPDWRAPGRRRGVVRAIDVTTRGIDVNLLLKHTTNDRRVAYVIYNRRIFTHARGWYRYTGSNPHINHVHVSVGHTAARENQTHSWFGTATTTTASTSKPQKKASWFSMATKTELREIIRDEIARRSSWGYKGAGNRDAWAILRNTENVVEELSETVGSKVWSHTNPYTDTDIYAYLRATHRSAVATEGKVAGLTKALEAISQGRDINLDEVRAAAEQGVSEALKSIDADITIHVNTEGE